MFIELLCKTNFSFLRGASSAPEYILQAQKLAMPALGITDRNGVYALPRAYEAIKELGCDIKLISGAQINMQDQPPLYLIATTRKSYGLLCRILTQVHAGKEKGQGVLQLSELIYFLDNFPGGAELICIPNTTATAQLEVLTEIFSKNIYLPLTRYLDGLDQKRAATTLEAANKFQIPILATNDVHYHVSERRPLQDALTSIREGVPIEAAGFHLFGNEERYLKSNLQMRALFSDLPEAILNTQVVAEKCQFSLAELKYTYPQEFIPDGHTAKSYLEELVYQGALETYRGLIPSAVDAQLRRELQFFEKRKDEHYFLTVQDIVRFARSKNILCQGRGSAANSLVCYVLGITSVDPVNMNLLFDRFMNDGRKEPPDIDIDFEHHRREEVIQYIYSRFGRERAAMVAAVTTYRRRSAFLELSKAVGIDVGTLSADALCENFDHIAGEKKGRHFFVETLSDEMKGFPRHLSIHSGGFVLSHDPLIEMVPIEPARMPGRTIIQWDKDDLETLGLMKVDVLSIGFLTALHQATDLAKISFRDIPPDDPKTYQMIQNAETLGTFQIESRAQINMLTQTKPQNYYDLVVQVALVRPSPTKGGMVQPFLKGLKESRRGHPFKIGHAALEKILGRTHGIPIFQEQIMQISMEVAGFTSAEADQLRRSLGKQRTAASVDAMGRKLFEALIKNAIPKEFAEQLFSYIQGYAHYGFPESHAASYASLAYKSAYMKCHYPAELVCALINSQPMGFYPIDTLINEAKRKGVLFLPMDPNKSFWLATLEAPRTIRMGFSQVKAIREPEVQKMIEARQQKLFQSLEDFISRTSFNKNVLENLAIANVFIHFGLDQRHSFWKSLEFSNLCQKNELGHKESKENEGKLNAIQLSLFSENLELTQQTHLFSEMTALEKMTADYSKTGYSLDGNLMKALRLELPHLPTLTSVQVKRLMVGKNIRYAGIMTVLQRPPPANGTAFLTLEDEFGSVDTILKKEIYEEFASVIKGSRFLVIEACVQKRGLGTSLLVSKVESFVAPQKNNSQQPITHGAHPRSLGRLGVVLT